MISYDYFNARKTLLTSSSYIAPITLITLMAFTAKTANNRKRVIQMHNFNSYCAI